MIDVPEYFDVKEVSMNQCFTGGAAGSDHIFALCADLSGHGVVHMSFKGHKRYPSPGRVYELSNDELNVTYTNVQKASILLNRSMPKSDYVRNLLCRNYYQINKTINVYAVCELDTIMHVPKGGTAWAIAMALLSEAQRNIYIYEPIIKSWFKYKYAGKMRNFNSWQGQWKSWGIPSQPEGIYTGIGTRDITPDAVEAIFKLYRKGHIYADAIHK